LQIFNSHLLAGCVIYCQRIPQNLGISARLERNMLTHPKRTVHSLKIEVPPAAELERARDQILKQLASFNPERDKIRTIQPTRAAQRNAEEIIDRITIELRAHKRPKQSDVRVYNEVVLACGSVPKPPTRPVVEEKITKQTADASRKLHAILGNPDLPRNHIFCVFGSAQNFNQFIDSLEQLAALTYSKPPPNTDRVKRECAKLAYLLITRCTTQKPSGTVGGLFRTIAGLLHQFACPTHEGEIVDLKTACDEVLRRAKAGIKIENDRW
jgi:hypothetical protein